MSPVTPVGSEAKKEPTCCRNFLGAKEGGTVGLAQTALNNWILSMADRGAPPKSWECCQMPLAVNSFRVCLSCRTHLTRVRMLPEQHTVSGVRPGHFSPTWEG